MMKRWKDLHDELFIKRTEFDQSNSKCFALYQQEHRQKQKEGLEKRKTLQVEREEARESYPFLRFLMINYENEKNVNSFG